MVHLCPWRALSGVSGCPSARSWRASPFGTNSHQGLLRTCFPGRDPFTRKDYFFLLPWGSDLYPRKKFPMIFFLFPATRIKSDSWINSHCLHSGCDIPVLFPVSCSLEPPGSWGAPALRPSLWPLTMSWTLTHVSAPLPLGSLSHKTAAMKFLLLGRKARTNPDCELKSKDITLLTTVCIVKAMGFPVVMYGCKSCIVKMAGHQRMDAFELWCWRRPLRFPWKARRSNQSILKEINPGYSLEGRMLKFQYFGHLMWRDDHWKRPWCWERLKAGG